MSLGPGSRLSHYELTSLLGEGGMGRVFLARDSKLGRSVAVKVLPDELATDTERIARFEREAKVLASLNHPHIASLITMDHAEGHHFLVMELVDGETIADRLRRGPIPADEVVQLTVQIVDALETAHAQGIVHRDLKPANVKVTPEGIVKVLDFGLAKAMDQVPGIGDPGSGNRANSPTLSMMATQAGMILGTAAYMSPEQAKGAAADARSDVFSLGCMLFEMLTGRQPFEGETAPEILASVLAREPDFAILPSNLNPRLRDLVKRCLEKKPKQRWQAIGDLRIELEAIASGAGRIDVMTPSPAMRPLTWWRRALPVATLTAIVVAAIAGSLAWTLKPVPAPAVVKFSVYPPERTVFVTLTRPGASGAISPDGSTLAFTARDETGKTQLWLRRLDAPAPQALSGTEGAAFPFWSPDSQFIGFFALGKLQKISVAGGPPQTLCDARSPQGGAWNGDGVIIFNPSAGAGLMRVASGGGLPTLVTTATSAQNRHSYPSFLPDGRHFLFYANRERALFSGSLDGGDPVLLMKDAESSAVFSSSGHLLVARRGVLLAQLFDPATLAFSGDPFPVGNGVASQYAGQPTFSVSRTGTIAYGSGGSLTNGGQPQQLVWVDRQGKVIQSVGGQVTYKGLDLSPDQRRLAFHQDEGSGGDVWVLDLDRSASSRLTFDGPVEHTGSPVWSPDGTKVAYQTRRAGKWTIRLKAATGTEGEDVVLESADAITPMAWSPDGRMIVYQVADPKNDRDLWVLPLQGDRKPFVFQSSRAGDTHPQVSPDGRWIAYTSAETGQAQVYIRSFPSGPGKWTVSTNGGGTARWRGDSKELFYTAGRAGTGDLMSVELRSTGTLLELSTPRLLFPSGYLDGGPDEGGNYHTFAVSRDGQRFLFPRSPTDTQAPTMADPIAVIVNWAAGLKK